MLKASKTEETRLFCHIFINGGISIEGRGGGPQGPHSGYAFKENFVTQKNLYRNKIL